MADDMIEELQAFAQSLGMDPNSVPLMDGDELLKLSMASNLHSIAYDLRTVARVLDEIEEDLTTLGDVTTGRPADV